MNPVDNQRARRELARIHWRRWVMSLPGGVAWLRAKAILYKFRERDLGPHALAFPEVP